MSKHKLLHISSKDKTEGTNSNFSLNLSNHYWLQAVKSIVVKHITLENVFYNINSTNDSFTYNIASTPSTVSITQGNYTITELGTALDAAMVAAGVVGFTTTLNSITEKLTFASTTAIEYVYDTNEMADTLGITVDGGADVSSYSSAGFPKLEGVRNLLIASSALGENNYLASDQKISDVIAVMPITGSFGDVINYISTHNEIDNYETTSKKSGKNVSQVDIRVIDADTNTVVDLANHTIDLVLKVYY